MDSDAYQDIEDASVPRRAEQFAFMRELVRIDTSPAQLLPSKAVDKIADLIEGFGFSVESYHQDGARYPVLVSRLVGGDGPTLAFASHLDTLAAADGWRFDPWDAKIENGELFGLGALSGKGHLTAQVFAVLALMDSGTPVNGAIEFHISFDGETGARSTKWLLSDVIAKPDMAIVGGPARAVAQYTAGVIRLDVEVIGKPAPAFAPDDGLDALEAAAQAVTRLYQFRSGLSGHRSDIPGVGDPAMVIDGMRAGNPEGGVPGTADFQLERRIVPGEDVSQVDKQLTKLIGSTIASIPGVRCRIRKPLMQPPVEPTAQSKLLAQTLNEVLSSKVEKPPMRMGVGYETSARWYAAEDVPTVLYGTAPLEPAASGLYGADERQNLNDLRLATGVLAGAAARLLRGD